MTTNCPRCCSQAKLTKHIHFASFVGHCSSCPFAFTGVYARSTNGSCKPDARKRFLLSYFFLERILNHRTLFALLTLVTFFTVSTVTTVSTISTTYADPYLNKGGEFSFVRLQYDTRFGSDFRMNPWATDFPAADINFLKGVTRLTRIKVNQDPIVLRLDDDAIFDHPFLYAVEMGRSGGAFLTLKETGNLREYLLRGGFLLVDDFWGTYQWEVFERVMQQVFPERPIVRLPDDHEVFHGFYDVPGAQMIPALSNYENRPEADVEFASNHAIFDDDGRMMVLINWNSDMGDGWEHTYHNDYPVKYANQSYQLGINFLMYALTH